MALDNSQRQQIHNNIEKLDYLNGTGVLTDSKKELVKELFLIISAGGVGGKALIELKKTLMREVDNQAVERQIQFICADTAHNELKEMISSGVITENECLKIPYEGAYQVINPATSSETTKEWVHKGLYDRTKSKKGYFDGNGAGALRQCGRVMFAQAATQERLYQKLLGVRNKATFMTDEGITDCSLKVIFLAGISGGTGSGTIIDLGFLTRFYLNEIMDSWADNDRITYSAYLFLPSACGIAKDPLDGTNGNRNAYAALKEIDYFMNLKGMKEAFRMDYGTPNTRNMIIRDNLFDFCTLVEGVGNGGVFFGDPDETSRKITVLSIMNILCANNTGTLTMGGKRVFMVDSFLSNHDTQSRTRILAQPDRLWPREANYNYNIIGYATCVVPVNLLTVYAFKKVFDVIYEEFSKNKMATDDAAKNFMQRCGLDFRTVDKNYKSMTPAIVSRNLEQVSSEIFKKLGPYYMINLTKRAVALIDHPTEGYIAQCTAKKGGFFEPKGKWEFIIQLYNYVRDQLIQTNNSLYDIYTFIIEEMNRMLAGNAGILTESKELQNKFGSSFYWTPIDLTNGVNATTAVTSYLDGLMNPRRVSQLAYTFVDQMYARKDRWTRLIPREGQGTVPFDVADEIRLFIKTQMSDLVSKTLEDFIVMAYSGDPNAKVSEMVNGVEVPSEATKIAAEQIMSKLRTNAVPLALASSNGFMINQCYHNVYLTLPEKCDWLYQAISEMNIQNLDRDHIFKSSANDSIVWSTLYSGVPAWALRWTKEGEEKYETGEGPNACGLHIEQGTKGRNWSELPNLYPEGLWNQDERRSRAREAAISAAVRRDMQEAKERGLLQYQENQPLNTLLRFGNGETADTLWESLEMTPNQKYSAGEMYQQLRDKGKAFDRELECVGFEAIDNSVSDKAGLAFYMSCKLVRKTGHERKDLTRTLTIARDLEARLAERNDGCVDMSAMTDFINAIKWKIFDYEPYSGQWTIVLATERLLGGKLSSNLEKQCAHYFAYKQYLALDDDTKEEIREAVGAQEEKADTNIFKAQAQETDGLKQSINRLRLARNTSDQPWPQDSPFAYKANNASWPMSRISFENQAALQGVKADDIRSFYENFEMNL